MEFEPWPAEADPLIASLIPLIEHVFELSAPDSPERKAVMGEVLALPARIRAALHRPRLN